MRLLRWIRNTPARQRSKFDKQRLQVLTTAKTYEFLLRDEHHLLRLCSASDWANVKKCCAILSRVFQSKSYEELASSSKKQLLVRDQWGNTPLHIACYHKPLPSVLHAILKAASTAPRGPLQLHTMVNDAGATPLVISCKAGACRQAIQVLLHPPKGLLPGGATVTMYDHQANTPFLGMVNRYNMIRKIPAYKQLCRPLEQVQELPPETTSPVIDCMGGSPWDSLLPDSMCHNNSRVVFPMFWKNIEDLLQAAWSTLHIRNIVFSPIHAAAYVADIIPQKLTDLILRVHSDQLRQSEILPLHLALIGATEHPQRHPQLIHQRAYFIERLLELDPSAAGTTIPGTNRSTFCQAIASGLSWNVESKAGPVRALFELCPDALLKQDVDTNLYPFLLAASLPSKGCDDDDVDDDDGCQLDTIYNLLRASPECIKG
jgi:hypothetical protein